MNTCTDPICNAIHTAKKIARLCYVPADAALLERAGVTEQLTEEEKRQRASIGALNLLQKKLKQGLKESEQLQLWEVSLPEHFRAWDMAANVHDAFLRLRQYGWRVQWRAKLIEILRNAVEVDTDSLEKAIRAEATEADRPAVPAAVDDQLPTAVQDADVALTERESEVDSVIRGGGPLTGKELHNKTGIGLKTLQNHVLPALKQKRGLINIRSRGYTYPR